MVRQFYRANRELVSKLLFLTVFFLIVYVFFHFVFDFVGPFVFGFLISLLLVPFVDFFEKRLRIHRGIGTAFCMVLVLVLLFFLGTSVVSKIISEVQALAEKWPQYVEQLSVLGNQLKGEYDNLLSFVPEQFTAVVERALSSLTASLTEALGSFVKDGSFQLVRSLPNFLMTTLLCIISVFFFTKDQRLIKKSVREATPLWLSDGFYTVRHAMAGALLGYFKAQLMLMSVTATVCVVGLTVIGFPYALLIGLLASFVDALPVFGVGFIFWQLAFVNFLSGNYGIAMGIMVIDVIVIIVRQFLEPKLIGTQIGLHPILTLLSIYVGLKTFGLFGFIIGPLTLVVIKVILESDKYKAPPENKQTEQPAEPAAEPDSIQSPDA